MSRRLVTIALEPIDVALVPLWYAAPSGVRKWIRVFLLHVARWPGVQARASARSVRQAEAEGAYEALLLNERGRLVEGSRSNVALVFPDGVVTPPKSEGCVPGTVRRRLIEKGALAEEPLSPEDLALASEVLLMNSLIGVLPVARINGREIPVGPAAARLRKVFENL